MPLTPDEQAEFEERFQALEDRNAKLERLIRSGRAFTNNPLALATDLDDLGSVKTHLDFEEPPLTPGTPPADVGRMYAADEDGKAKPYWVDDAGNVYSLALEYTFGAHRAATQSIGASAWTRVDFNVEDFDDDNDYDAVTNFRYTTPIAGKYFFHANIGITITSAGSVVIAGLFVNSAETIHGTRIVTHASAEYNLTVSATLDLAAGVMVDAAIWQNAGTMNVTSSAAANRFYGHIVSL